MSTVLVSASVMLAWRWIVVLITADAIWLVSFSHDAEVGLRWTKLDWRVY